MKSLKKSNILNFPPLGKLEKNYELCDYFKNNDDADMNQKKKEFLSDF